MTPHSSAKSPIEEHVEALYGGLAKLHERISAEANGLRADFAKADSALEDHQRTLRAAIDRLDSDAVDVTVRTVPLQVLALVLLALGSLSASIPVLFDLA